MQKDTRHFSSKRSMMVFSMMLRELRLIKKIPSLFIMVFIYPILIMGIFFAIYNQGSITQIPIAIIDQDQSVASRELIQKVAASSEIQVSERYHDLSVAKKDLLAAKVYAVIMIPPDFEKQMLANTQPEVTTFYNNQYMTVGSTASRAISTSLSGLISEIQLQKMANNSIPTAIGKSQLKPIDIDLRPLFNPTLSFIVTLVSGAFPAVMQIIMMFAVTASIQKERRYQPNLNSLRRLAHNNPFTFMLNKCAMYFAIFIIPLLLMDIIMINYYGLSIQGSLPLLLLGDLLFISSSLAIGSMFAIFIADQFTNFGVVGIFSSPAFGFTGLIFPRLAMNGFAYVWGGLLPVTWYIQLRLDQTLRGLTSIEALTPIFFMLLLTIISLSLIGFKFKQYSKQGGK
ncbi:ABC transporter permease [Orbus mooreae]|uniref:ABC transporter permease n=1 Tax=Orbus mooreae TaxID=3074107 RepID=UPI00370D096F